MNCCDAAGNCTNGLDCPIRKQRIEAVNKAYVERGMVTDPNPYDETIGTFKALVIVLAVCIAVTLVFFVWGKT